MAPQCRFVCAFGLCPFVPAQADFSTDIPGLTDSEYGTTICKFHVPEVKPASFSKLHQKIIGVDIESISYNKIIHYYYYYCYIIIIIIIIIITQMQLKKWHSQKTLFIKAAVLTRSLGKPSFTPIQAKKLVTEGFDYQSLHRWTCAEGHRRTCAGGHRRTCAGGHRRTCAGGRAQTNLRWGA